MKTSENEMTTEQIESSDLEIQEINQDVKENHLWLENKQDGDTITPSENGNQHESVFEPEYDVTAENSSRIMNKLPLSQQSEKTLRGDEYLQEMGEPIKTSFRFVGGGEQVNGEIILAVSLSADLKNHIANEDWRGDQICLLVGKNREVKMKNTHWVAVKSGQWSPIKINDDAIEGVWVDKKNGKFAFVISKEFVKQFRSITSKNNQKLFLKVRFGIRATAGKIWITPNYQ